MTDAREDLSLVSLDDGRKQSCKTLFCRIMDSQNHVLQSSFKEIRHLFFNYNTHTHKIHDWQCTRCLVLLHATWTFSLIVLIYGVRGS